jgi:hypothetical protein
MRWVLLALFAIGLNAKAGDTDWVSVPDTLDPKLARRTIEEIWQQSQIFYQDRGVFPDSVEQLVDMKYVVLDDAAREQWVFHLNYGPKGAITAKPVYDREGNGKKSKINGYWIGQHSLTFEALTGQWRGYGIPNYRVDSLTAEDKADLTIEVRRVMLLTAEACDTYYQDRGEWPKFFDELRNHKYVLVPTGVYVQWDIELIGEPPNRIDAYSTHVMQGGSGHLLIYDVERDKFEGFGAYGREEMLESLNKGLFKKRSRSR